MCLCFVSAIFRYFVEPGQGARSSVGGLSAFGTEDSVQHGEGGAQQEEDLTERNNMDYTERNNMDASNYTLGSLNSQMYNPPMTKRGTETIPEGHDYGSESFQNEASEAKKPERRFSPVRIMTGWGVNLGFTDEIDV
jgi:hypothetical protein